MDVKIKRNNGDLFTVGYVPEVDEISKMPYEDIVYALSDHMRRAAEKAYIEARIEFESEIKEFLDRNKTYLW